MSISDRFVLARKKLGYNQVDFSKKLGVSSSAITNYERGVNDIPVALVIKLGVMFEVSPSWLLFGDGSMFAKGAGQLVEDAAIAVLEVFIEEGINAKPEKAAKLIRHFFEEMAEGNLGDKNEQIRRTKLVI